MFNNNESQFDPSFKHSSRYSQTAARYGKTDSSGPRGDVENGGGRNWATQHSMNLMQNAPPAINTGRGKVIGGSNNNDYNQQYRQQHQDHHRNNYGTNQGGRSPNGGRMDESLIDRDYLREHREDQERFRRNTGIGILGVSIISVIGCYSYYSVSHGKSAGASFTSLLPWSSSDSADDDYSAATSSSSKHHHHSSSKSDSGDDYDKAPLESDDEDDSGKSSSRKKHKELFSKTSKLTDNEEEDGESEGDYDGSSTSKKSKKKSSTKKHGDDDSEKDESGEEEPSEDEQALIDSVTQDLKESVKSAQKAKKAAKKIDNKVEKEKVVDPRTEIDTTRAELLKKAGIEEEKDEDTGEKNEKLLDGEVDPLVAGLLTKDMQKAEERIKLVKGTHSHNKKIAREAEKALYEYDAKIEMEKEEKIRKKQQAAIDAEKAKYEEAARREVEEQEKKNKIHAEEERMRMEIAKAKADAATKIAMAKAKEVSSKAAAEDKVKEEIEAKMHPKEDESNEEKTQKTWSLSSDPIDGVRSDDDVDNFVEQAEKEGAHVSKEDKETLEEAQRERMVAEEQLIEAKMEAAKVQTQAQEIMKASETRAAEAAAEAKREAQAEIDAAKLETEKVKASAQALLSHQQATDAEKVKLKADLENEKSKEGDIAREAAISAAKMLQEEDNASTSTSESSSAASEEEKATATTETEAESASTGTTQENAIVDDEKLPEPWKAVLDSESGKTYYWNTETQETSWDKPSQK